MSFSQATPAGCLESARHLGRKTFEPILIDMALSDRSMLLAKSLGVRTGQTLEEV